MFDPMRRLGVHGNLELASLAPLDRQDQNRVRELLEAHRAATGSRKARALLQRFTEALACFRRVAPIPAAAAPAAVEVAPINLAAIV